LKNQCDRFDGKNYTIDGLNIENVFPLPNLSVHKSMSYFPQMPQIIIPSNPESQDDSTRGSNDPAGYRDQNRAFAIRITAGELSGEFSVPISRFTLDLTAGIYHCSIPTATIRDLNTHTLMAAVSNLQVDRDESGPEYQLRYQYDIDLADLPVDLVRVEVYSTPVNVIPGTYLGREMSVESLAESIFDQNNIVTKLGIHYQEDPYISMAFLNTSAGLFQRAIAFMEIIGDGGSATAWLYYPHSPNFLPIEGNINWIGINSGFDGTPSDHYHSEQSFVARNTNPVGCQGDFNLDGHVDQADLNILLSSFGRNAGGDLNRNGNTDVEDLSTLLSLLGRTCS